MAGTPPARRPAGTVWFVAWLSGGVALLILSWVLTDLYYEERWLQSVFAPVHPSPGYVARRLFFDSVLQLPWVGLGYGLAGAWAFRRRGCLAAACAAAFAGCPCLFQVAQGLGRL